VSEAKLALGWTESTIQEFEALAGPVSNWGRWGDDDELGTVNLLTPQRAAAAAAAVQSGRSIGLGRVLTTAAAADNPNPLLHLMKSSGEAAPDRGGAHASEWIGLGFHGFSTTHIDAHSHQFWNGRIYNDRPAADVRTSHGARHGSVLPYAGGLVGRGVLLDAPRSLGRPWMEPGDGLGPDDLDRIATEQHVVIGSGDLVLVRTGRDARAAELGVIDPMTVGSPGLTMHCLAWLRGHDVAVLGSDVQSDVMIPGGPPHQMPVHAGALALLGLPLLDNLFLEELATACDTRQRWDFLLTVAPLALRGATGSPVNPIALL
jgi:kynurenine formamidase